MLGTLWRAGALAVTLCVGTFAHGHRFSAGDLVLDHPYAIPTHAGAVHGAAYLRGIRNKGHRAERLLGASTSVADRVALRQGGQPGTDLPGRELAAIELPAGQTTLLRHRGNYHLALIQLKRPLREGDRFDLTLHFERSGSQTVKVWVQAPRDSVSAVHQHP